MLIELWPRSYLCTVMSKVRYRLLSSVTLCRHKFVWRLLMKLEIRLPDKYGVNEHFPLSECGHQWQCSDPPFWCETFHAGADEGRHRCNGGRVRPSRHPQVHPGNHYCLWQLSSQALHAQRYSWQSWTELSEGWEGSSKKKLTVKYHKSDLCKLPMIHSLWLICKIVLRKCICTSQQFLMKYLFQVIFKTIPVPVNI